MNEIEAYIGVGSNIEPELHIANVLAALEHRHGPIRTSPLYRSAPVGFEGPPFINGVILINSRLGLDALIEDLKGLERQSGRNHQSEGMGSRELDLDLLLYGESVVHRNDLVLPRPDILKYPFVLRPLAELAPTRLHPETGRSFAWHWEHFAGIPAELEPVTLPEA
ncbi:MAG TPA: 2-amino-4-hydroxy-6-hydroxymethyldihydropteridine diphosphokinase [Gammaproteobacteria bacterium]|nr:2-amino-4-hydroxy-6-hydroxymethyldihydropteridine diphosphokinase [Gammaproteobacteria bacterium]